MFLLDVDERLLCRDGAGVLCQATLHVAAATVRFMDLHDSFDLEFERTGDDVPDNTDIIL